MTRLFLINGSLVRVVTPRLTATLAILNSGGTYRKLRGHRLFLSCPLVGQSRLTSSLNLLCMKTQPDFGAVSGSPGNEKEMNYNTPSLTEHRRKSQETGFPVGYSSAKVVTPSTAYLMYR